MQANLTALTSKRSLLALLILLAAALRFWQLGAVPPGYHFDEAFEGLEAWRLIHEPGYRPLFFTGNFGVDAMYVYLTSLAFRLLGEGPTVQRALSALLGTLTLPALWLWARELRHWDERLPPSFPLWSTALLGVLFWALQVSRIGYEPVLIPLFMALLLWALLRALRSGYWADALLAGSIGGLALYTYPVARPFPLLGAALIALALTLGRATLAPAPRRWLGWSGLALLVGWLLVGGPILLFWARHPELLLLRSSQIAVGSSPALGADLALTLPRVAGMFSLVGDMDPRNNLPGRPLFDPLLAPFFYGGLLVALRRAGRLPGALLLLCLLFGLAPTLFSDYAPHFRRAVGAMPAVVALAGLGLSTVWGWAGQRGAARGALRLALLLLALGSAGLNVRDYFGRWARSPDLFYAFDEGLWQVAAELREGPRGERRFLSPVPASHNTLAFAWRGAEGATTFDGRHILVLPSDPALALDYAVITHEDARLPLLLRDIFPRLQQVGELRDGHGAPYATLFRVPAHSPRTLRPDHRSGARWAGRVRLLGYSTLSDFRPGDLLYLRLFWQVEGAVGEEWTFFAHLLDAGGQNVLGQDQLPGAGSYPTSRWQAGELLVDEVAIPIPPDFAPGRYPIEIGFYRADLARVPMQGEAGSGDRLLLEPLTIQPR